MSIPLPAQNPLQQQQQQPQPLPLPPQNNGQTQDIGDQVGQDPSQMPSPLLMIASKVVKFGIPLLLVIGGLILGSAALVKIAPIALPFVLITGAALLIGAGLGIFTIVCGNDGMKDMQINRLQQELEKAQKEKGKVSSQQALEQETKKLEEDLKKNKNRSNELNTLKANVGLSRDEEEELKKLEEEEKRMKAELEMKNGWLAKLKEKSNSSNSNSNPGPSPSRNAQRPLPHLFV